MGNQCLGFGERVEWCELSETAEREREKNKDGKSRSGERE